MKIERKRYLNTLLGGYSILPNKITKRARNKKGLTPVQDTQTLVYSLKVPTNLCPRGICSKSCCFLCVYKIWPSKCHAEAISIRLNVLHT